MPSFTQWMKHSDSKPNATGSTTVASTPYTAVSEQLLGDIEKLQAAEMFLAIQQQTRHLRDDQKAVAKQKAMEKLNKYGQVTSKFVEEVVKEAVKDAISQGIGGAISGNF